MMFNFMKTKHRIMLRGCVMILGIMGLSFKSAAVDVQLTAEFKPDITQPYKNEFTNTTPQGGVCLWYPSACKGSTIFSVLVPGHFGYKNFNPKTSDHLQEGLGYKIDSRTKNIKLRNTVTNKEISAGFRLTLLGIKFRKTNNGGEWWEAITYNRGTSGGCQEIRKSTGSSGPDIDYIIQLPYSVPTCYGVIHPNASWSGEIGLPIMSFGYSLTTPNPLEIQSGVYEGEVVYNVNNGVDNNGIQFGTTGSANDQIRFKIRATVEHAFFYKFPAGSENVFLTPPEGWSSWINGGQIPGSLRKEVPFTLTTSQPFKVKILCQYSLGQNCALQKQGGTEQVPLEVKTTIPGLKTSSGADVRDHVLSNSAQGSLFTNDGFYMTDRRSVLNFQVKRPEVETMVKESGSVWKGGVTIVFDTEI